MGGIVPADEPAADSADSGSLIRCERPSCQPRCSADMVWRISAGLGPEDPEEPEDPEGPVDPPTGPTLATVVRRCGGLARSWGARLACLTRRGSPLMSPSPSGSAVPELGADPSDPKDPEDPESGPVSRESSQGGLEA
jgi:hypothetical protein